mgnify:FL=1
MYPSVFTESEIIKRLTAKMLIEAGAVHFNPEKPYKLTSGLRSPVYIDCRKLISFPRIRNTLMDFAVTMLRRDVGFEQFDAVAGGETAGIPFASWIADRMYLPMQYVRKEPKGVGRGAQIEGIIVNNQRVLLVEDLATDGGSKIKFCKVLRDAGAIVNHAFVIFYYDIFPETSTILESNKLILHSLANWHDILSVSKSENYFDVKVITEVEDFLNAPLAWSKKHEE